MTYQVDDTERQALEAAGWLYCHTCQGWYDDTYCWPEDHSHHCGHLLKPTGDDWIPDATMVLVCRTEGNRSE